MARKPKLVVDYEIKVWSNQTCWYWSLIEYGGRDRQWSSEAGDGTFAAFASAERAFGDAHTILQLVKG